MKKLIAVFLTSIFFIGCGIQNKSFLDQKYTRLKTNQVFVDESMTPESVLKSQEELNDNNKQAFSNALSYIPEKEDIFELERSKSLVVSNLISETQTKVKETVHHRKKTENSISKLTEDDSKSKNLKDFNTLFYVGLIIFILTIVFYLLAFLLNINGALSFLLLATLGILISWVISFVLVFKARTISEDERTNAFRAQLFLAYLVAIGGIIVVIGGVIGIIILLFF